LDLQYFQIITFGYTAEKLSKSILGYQENYLELEELFLTKNS